MKIQPELQGKLNSNFLSLLEQAENLTERMERILKVSTTLPKTFDELSVLIQISAAGRSGILSISGGGSNLPLFNKELVSSKNYISDTDNFFV